MKKYPLTLVEIMGVVALIVILMVIAIGAYSYASDASKEKATTATITRLNNALATLNDQGVAGLRTTTTGNADTNGYVPVKFDADNKKLYFGSTGIGEDAEAVFQLFARNMDADNIDSILDKDGFIVDGWGQQILIRFPGKFNRGGFDIISAGSDGVFGEDDGSASETVPPVDKEKYRNIDGDGEIICDDVTNFL